GVSAAMDGLVIEHRLESQIPDVYRWAFRRLAEESTRRGIRVYVVYRPDPVDLAHREAARRGEVLGCALEAGLGVIDLSSTFDHVGDRATLVLSLWDKHINAAGHRLLADELYESLAPHLAE